LVQIEKTQIAGTNELYDAKAEAFLENEAFVQSLNLLLWGQTSGGQGALHSSQLINLRLT
jgi:hypothetical protein